MSERRAVFVAAGRTSCLFGASCRAARAIFFIRNRGTTRSRTFVPVLRSVGFIFGLPIVSERFAVLCQTIFTDVLLAALGRLTARTGFALCRGRAATFVSLFVRSVAVRHVIELTARMVVCVYLAVFNAANFTFCFFGTSSRSAFMGFKVYFVAALTFVPVVRSVRRPGRGVRVLMRGLAVLFTADRAYESGRHYEDQTQ